MLIPQSWVCLIIAIFSGVSGTISMKMSHGLRKLTPSVCLGIFYFISFVALTLALQGMDMSIVYAIWSGVGTVLVAIISVKLFHEKLSVKKIISLFLIVVGVIGINLVNAIH